MSIDVCNSQSTLQMPGTEVKLSTQFDHLVKLESTFRFVTMCKMETDCNINQLLKCATRYCIDIILKSICITSTTLKSSPVLVNFSYKLVSNY